MAGAAAVKKFALAPEPAYYFSPKWSPDSKKIAFYDNRLKTYMLDTTTGKLTVINDKNVYGGFSSGTFSFCVVAGFEVDCVSALDGEPSPRDLFVFGGFGAVNAGDKRDGRFARAGV